MRSLQRDPLYLELVHFYMIIYVHLYLSIYKHCIISKKSPYFVGNSCAKSNPFPITSIFIQNQLLVFTSYPNLI